MATRMMMMQSVYRYVLVQTNCDNLLWCLQHKLTTVHWSVAGGQQCIASGDEKGHVVIWNIVAGDFSSYQSLSTDVHVFCLTFSPRTEHVLAVG